MEREFVFVGCVLTNPITHSFNQSWKLHSIQPQSHPPILHQHTHTPPSLISIIQINNNTCLNPQSNPSHINHPSSSSHKSISLSLSLCVFDVIERMTFPSSQSITHHTPSFLPLSLWMNCVDVDDCVVVVVMNINSIKTHQIKSNQESNTFFHISENEGRECASSTMHACARLKYDCGQDDSIPGRTPSEVIKWNKSAMLETLISEYGGFWFHNDTINTP